MTAAGLIITRDIDNHFYHCVWKYSLAKCEDGVYILLNRTIALYVPPLCCNTAVTCDGSVLCPFMKCVFSVTTVRGYAVFCIAVCSTIAVVVLSQVS